MIRFSLPIAPVPKARARVLKSGRSYTPRKTKLFERQVGLFARRYAPITPLDVPLKLSLRFILVRPKSSKRALPSVKPDIDNYIKAVKDALNGIIWSDDSRICEVHAVKEYGASPRIDVEVDTWKGDTK